MYLSSGDTPERPSQLGVLASGSSRQTLEARLRKVEARLVTLDELRRERSALLRVLEGESRSMWQT